MHTSGVFRWGTFFIILAIFIGILFSPTHTVQAGQTDKYQDYAGLVARAQTDGAVRVIITLDIGKPFVPEGDLNQRDQLLQRQAIQKAQAVLMNALANRTVITHALYKYVPYAAIEVNADTLEYLSKLPVVTQIQEDRLILVSLASSTQVIGAPTVWNAGVTGSGWTVAVLDTGVQWDHPFLGGSAASRVVSEACYSTHTTNHNEESLCPAGWNVDSQITGHAADPTTDRCLNGGTILCAHGTHVAGIAAGSGASYNGVAPGANIIAVQVFTRFNLDSACGGTGTAPCIASYSSAQMLGLQRVYDLHTSYSIASVNMSLGGSTSNSTYCDTDPLKSYIDNLLSVGISTIIASGNNGFTTGISAPACISTAVAVGATSDADQVASFSNSSSLIDLLAPGVSIDSSVPVSTYANYSGTSMATPHVAGAFALLKSYNPSATAADILAALQNTGVSVTDTRNGVIKPRIQVDAAANSLQAALTWVGNTTAWNQASNWNVTQVPTSLSSVIIPTSPVGGDFPSLNTTANVYNLTVQNGANLAMTGGTLNVYKNFSVQAGGAFNASGGITVFPGYANQSISMPDDANNQFYHLQIGNGSSHHTISSASPLDINGDLTIAAGAYLNPGSNIVNLAGNWVDVDGNFIPGSSTVAFDGSGQTAQVTAAQLSLLQESFSDYDAVPYPSFYPSGPAGWLVENTGGANYPWFFTGWARTPNTAMNGHARHYWAGSGDSTTWMFTPGLSLYAGIGYQLQYRYGAYSASGTRALRVAMGNTQASGSMTTILHDFADVGNTTWATDVVNFTVPADGTYYIGFRAYVTGATTDDISIDDVSVTGTPQLLFYNLNVQAAGNGLILADNAQVNHNLTIYGNDQLNLGNNILHVEGTLTNNGRMSQTRSAPSGTTTSFLNVTNMAGTTSKYYGVDITPAADMGSTTVSIWGNQASCTDNPADALIGRCFSITPGSNQNATVRFWYTEAERHSQLANGLLLWHTSNTPPYTWAQVGNGYTYSEAGTPCASGGGQACWMQANNVATYSPFGLGSGSAPTAIQLRSLHAGSGRNLLPWAALAAAGLVLMGGLIFFARKRM